MAALRQQDQLSAAEVVDLWPDTAQRSRILAGLVSDGLAEAERDDDGVPLAYRLPTADSH